MKHPHPACEMCDDKDNCDPTCLILEASKKGKKQ